MAIEVDWSSGHSANRAGALNINTMSVKSGGMQSVPRPSKMTESCLRLGALLKPGEFREGDPPPKFERKLTDFVGKAKGKRQVLYERGKWKNGIVKKVDDDDQNGWDQVKVPCAALKSHRAGHAPGHATRASAHLLNPPLHPASQTMSMNYMLSNCEDFVNEKSAPLHTLVEARGHILVMSPKGHCELAGQGIEYDWGKPKQNFRRKNKYIKFHDYILCSMSRSVLSRSTSRKFARKPRAYRRAYREGVDNEHARIESMIKVFKAHRNAADFAGKFVRKV